MKKKKVRKVSRKFSSNFKARMGSWINAIYALVRLLEIWF